MRKLYDILNTCVDRNISTMYINGQKLFPYNECKLSLKENSVNGYFNIVDNITNDTLLLLGLRLADGTFKNFDYTVTYKNDKIAMIEFDIYKIFFVL